MFNLAPLEREVAQLIVDSLNLEGIDAGGIDPEAPLFDTGLGLDSIDALELALAIKSKYGFQIKSGDSDITQIFSSLRSLSRHIEHARSR